MPHFWASSHIINTLLSLGQSDETPPPDTFWTIKFFLTKLHLENPLLRWALLLMCGRNIYRTEAYLSLYRQWLLNWKILICFLFQFFLFFLIRNSYSLVWSYFLVFESSRFRYIRELSSFIFETCRERVNVWWRLPQYHDWTLWSRWPFYGKTVTCSSPLLWGYNLDLQVFSEMYCSKINLIHEKI